ncbi:NADH-quinone oxidoreductase subunit NuoE [bacterium]|nr:NADH-quinone oxidoreductase subunit NuoE [bacterium]
MSARRFQDPDVTGTFVLSPDTEQQVAWWEAKYPRERRQSAVIPALWIAQKQNGGWLSEPAMRAVADRLGMPYIRVYEVATFYTMFNLAPVGTWHVQLCGTTPCALRGAEALKSTCEARIGPKGSVTSDGKLSWVEVECLGACVNAPMVQINDYYYEDLTPESLAGVLEDLAAGRAVKPGTYVVRQTSAPEGGATTLLDDALYDGSRAVPLTVIPGAPAPATAAAEPVATAPAAPEIQTKRSPEAPVDVVPPGDRPQGLASARAGQADDLKLIAGIGPKIEATLNSLGVFHFDQIAAWTRANVEWVDGYLSFKGRIDREDWIAQAKQLASPSSGKGARE